MNVDIVANERAWQNMADAKQPGQPTITYSDRGAVHLGGKRVELYYFGRAHTNGDTFVYFPEQRALAAGDAFTFGDATPQLIDYAGGGSAKEWTKTLDGALGLDFDAVVPGHGNVTNKTEMRRFRDSTLTVRNRVREMILQKKTRDEIAKMLQSEFKWGQLQMARALDGMIAELQ
jgi:glyoxylase-like metal-dependent hydrolase (beta-lactamase superfamily II)